MFIVKEKRKKKEPAKYGTFRQQTFYLSTINVRERIFYQMKIEAEK